MLEDNVLERTEPQQNEVTLRAEFECLELGRPGYGARSLAERAPGDRAESGPGAG